MTKPAPLPPPLAGLNGEALAAPSWFTAAQADPVETGAAAFEGDQTAWKAWGERGRPGLVLIHGGTAHKGWWDAIGPFLAREGWRVVAPDLPGMGESSWREEYTLEHHGRAMLAAAIDGGACEAGRPVFAGHSFGGFVTLKSATTFGDQLKAAIILDSPIRKPEKQREGAPPKRGGKIYPDLATALGRFRLLPEQDCDNLWLVDHIARGSLKEADGGYTWWFDPGIWAKLSYERRDPDAAAASLQCPLAFIRGAQSKLMQAETWDYMRGVFTRSPFITVPEAQHHLVLDQPLATAAAIHALIEGWTSA
ncbi:MAG: alpha/beta hydrolase [Alphaproteobacteria bacterium]|nr:alpha/beta hydrolase [Alphaproteobacteria bacterium]